jgi:hypothetical protein
MCCNTRKTNKQQQTNVAFVLFTAGVDELELFTLCFCSVLLIGFFLVAAVGKESIKGRIHSTAYYKCILT